MDQNTKDVLMLLIPAASAVAASYAAFKVAKLNTQVDRVEDNVQRVEKATNSHTDLLVAATSVAAHSAGKEEERIERRARDASRAIGAETPPIEPTAE
jgi:hypothetical protein